MRLIAALLISGALLYNIFLETGIFTAVTLSPIALLIGFLIPLIFEPVGSRSR